MMAVNWLDVLPAPLLNWFQLAASIESIFVLVKPTLWPESHFNECHESTGKVHPVAFRGRQA